MYALQPNYISYSTATVNRNINVIPTTDLDHTADVQCHAWGATMKDAFQNMAPCMMNYMTDLTLVNIDPDEPTDITIEGTVIVHHSTTCHHVFSSYNTASQRLSRYFP